MSNFSVNLNLLGLNKAFVKKMNSKAGPIDVLIIPIAMNNLFMGEKGIYLDLQAMEIRDKKPDQKNTHILKQSLPKAVYNTLTDEQKQAMPILGNGILWNQAPASTPNISTQSQGQSGYTANDVAGQNGGRVPDDDDLPF